MAWATNTRRGVHIIDRFYHRRHDAVARTVAKKNHSNELESRLNVEIHVTKFEWRWKHVICLRNPEFAGAQIYECEVVETANSTIFHWNLHPSLFIGCLLERRPNQKVHVHR